MCVRVGLSYTVIVVHMHMVQPAEVLVGLQEAGQLLVLSGRLGQQLPPLPFLHVPAEQKVSKVLKEGRGMRSVFNFQRTFFFLPPQHFFVKFETWASTASASCLHLISELGHVVLQAALVVRLLAHLHQDVEVAVLLSQRRHPLVLTQLHCKNRRAVRRAAASLNAPPEARGGCL